MGVEIIDLPYPAKSNHKIIQESIISANLLICCVDLLYLTANIIEYLRSLCAISKPSDSIILLAATHRKHYGFYEMDEKEWLRETVSKLYSYCPDLHDKGSQLFLLDSVLYVQGIKTNNFKMMDESRFCYLKSEIYRQIAKAYYNQLLNM